MFCVNDAIDVYVFYNKKIQGHDNVISAGYG